jgi:hypothetical protein
MANNYKILKSFDEAKELIKKVMESRKANGSSGDTSSPRECVS